MLIVSRALSLIGLQLFILLSLVCQMMSFIVLQACFLEMSPLIVELPTFDLYRANEGLPIMFRKIVDLILVGN